MSCRSQTMRYIEQGMHMPQNQHDLVVISETDLVRCWADRAVQRGQLSGDEAEAVCHWHATGELAEDEATRIRVSTVLETVLSNVGTGQSAVVASRLVNDFGGWGRYVEKQYNGTRYIIFKGYAGLRRLFPGTRYRADNPRIVSMGIGRLGVRDAAMAGARLTIVLIGAYRIADYLLRDEATLGQLIGRLASDVVKIATSAGIGYAISAAAAGVGVISTGLVAGPLIAAVIVGGGVGFFLEVMDRQYHFTDRLVVQVEQALETTVTLTTNPGYFVCRGREALADAIDTWIDAGVSAAMRAARNRLERIVGSQFYPSWHHLPR